MLPNPGLRFAWRNLARRPMRFGIACFGIAFAAFLMALQSSLLYGFTMAASRIVDAVEADVWIVGRNIPAFEFVAPLPERIAWIAAGEAGVGRTGSGIAGWVPFEKANGDITTVFLVGVESAFAGRLPDVRRAVLEVGGYERPIATDATDLATLSGSGADTRVAVNGRRADLVTATSGLASFLGTPFAVADFEDAQRLSNLPDRAVSFALASVVAGQSPGLVAARLQARFPAYSVFTSRGLSWRSRVFWLLKTGAGGALSLAALLGFLIGLCVVAQTIYSATTEQIEDYATMKALGATNAFVFRIVAAQALLCGALGTAVGLLLVEPAAGLARGIVTWAVVPDWVYPGVAVTVAALCLLAAMIAARPAVTIEPARVFRA